MENNPFFSCTLVEHKDSYSIILSQFNYFDDHLPNKTIGGYTIEKLAKQIAKEHQINDIQFDSEASLFTAYSTSKEPLLQICNYLKAFTGEEHQHIKSEPIPSNLSIEEEEYLLLKGL